MLRKAKSEFSQSSTNSQNTAAESCTSNSQLQSSRKRQKRQRTDIENRLAVDKTTELTKQQSVVVKSATVIDEKSTLLERLMYAEEQGLTRHLRTMLYKASFTFTSSEPFYELHFCVKDDQNFSSFIIAHMSANCTYRSPSYELGPKGWPFFFLTKYHDFEKNWKSGKADIHFKFDIRNVHDCFGRRAVFVIVKDGKNYFFVALKPSEVNHYVHEYVKYEAAFEKIPEKSGLYLEIIKKKGDGKRLIVFPKKNETWKEVSCKHIKNELKKNLADFLNRSSWYFADGKVSIYGVIQLFKYQCKNIITKYLDEESLALIQDAAKRYGISANANSAALGTVVSDATVTVYSEDVMLEIFSLQQPKDFYNFSITCKTIHKYASKHITAYVINNIKFYNDSVPLIDKDKVNAMDVLVLIMRKFREIYLTIVADKTFDQETRLKVSDALYTSERYLSYSWKNDNLSFSPKRRSNSSYWHSFYPYAIASHLKIYKETLESKPKLDVGKYQKFLRAANYEMLSFLLTYKANSSTAFINDKVFKLLDYIAQCDSNPVIVINALAMMMRIILCYYRKRHCFFEYEVTEIFKTIHEQSLKESPAKLAQCDELPKDLAAIESKDEMMGVYFCISNRLDLYLKKLLQQNTGKIAYAINLNDLIFIYAKGGIFDKIDLRHASLNEVILITPNIDFSLEGYSCSRCGSGVWQIKLLYKPLPGSMIERALQVPVRQAPLQPQQSVQLQYPAPGLTPQQVQQQLLQQQQRLAPQTPIQPQLPVQTQLPPLEQTKWQQLLLRQRQLLEELTSVNKQLAQLQSPPPLTPVAVSALRSTSQQFYPSQPQSPAPGLTPQQVQQQLLQQQQLLAQQTLNQPQFSTSQNQQMPLPASTQRQGNPGFFANQFRQESRSSTSSSASSTASSTSTSSSTSATAGIARSPH